LTKLASIATIGIMYIIRRQLDHCVARRLDPARSKFEAGPMKDPPIRARATQIRPSKVQKGVGVGPCVVEDSAVERLLELLVADAFFYKEKGIQRDLAFQRHANI